MIKVILWDIDGTLLNFEEAEKHAIRACFAQFGLGECTDSMLADYSAINRVFWQKLERGEMTKPEILIGRFTTFFEKYGLDTSCAPAFNAQYQISLGDTVMLQPQRFGSCASTKRQCPAVCSDQRHQGSPAAQAGAVRIGAIAGRCLHF